MELRALQEALPQLQALDVTHRGTPAARQELLEMIAQQPPREFHDWRAVHSHADACDTSCLDCLHSYSNLAYHNPLNSWLAIDMAQLPL